MKRVFFNGLLIICILSVLVLPAFATTTEFDEIVILRQPSDTFGVYSDSGSVTWEFNISAIGYNLSYQWQYSLDLDNWRNFADSNSPVFQYRYANQDGWDSLYVRCVITDGYGNSIISRVVLAEIRPTNIFNFIGSCLRYLTSYISLIVNSLVTPGAPLYPLLPVLCIGIAVAALLLVIRITKFLSWGA